MSDKNLEIKKAIDTFDIEAARSLLREALKEANAETYYLASLVSLDETQKITFLQKSIELDPFFEKSHEALKGFTNESIISKPNSLDKEPIAKPTSPSSPVTTDINQFITGVTQGNSESIPLYVIPIETGLVRTQLKKDVKVLLIERDERAEWFLCGYLSPIGQPIIGWLPSLNLQDISYLGKEINLLDLPITRFEPYNSRSDVQKLLLEKKKKLKSTVAPYVAGIVSMLLSTAFFLSIFFFLGLASYSDLTSSPLFLLLGCAMGGIGLTFLVIAILGITNGSKASQQNIPFNEELKRLDLLQKDMRSEYERLRDDQRFTLGIQAGLDTAKNLVGIAGNTVASKILTASNKPKDKKR